MNDAALVSAAHGLREPLDDRRRLGDGERSPAEALAESSPRDEGHDHVAPAPLGARVDDGDEAVGLAQAPEEAELAQRLLVAHVPGEELEGHLAPVGGASAVDDAHAAATHLLDRLVGADLHPARMTRRRGTRYPRSGRTSVPSRAERFAASSTSTFLAPMAPLTAGSRPSAQARAKSSSSPR